MSWIDNLLKKARSIPKPYELLQKIWTQNGGIWDKINIFGIRNEKANRQKDEFCDQIGIAINGEILLFAGTVDPSVWWTKNPVTVDGVTGAAHVCYGFHPDIWQIGKHFDQNPALIQTGNEVKIWRDIDGDFDFDGNEPVQSGWYGINFHSAKNSPTIGRWSAGCQVIQKQEDFDKAMKIVTTSESYKKNKKCKFSYMLFSDKQVKGIL